MNKRFVLSFLLVVLLSAQVAAITWTETLSLAAQNSNQLKSAEKQFESYEWSYKKTYCGFFPQLAASASLTETRSATVSAASKSYAYGLTITQNLFGGLSGIFDVQSAYADLEYYQANLADTRANVFYDVRTSFIDLLISQQNVVLLSEILDQRKQDTRLLKMRYESGKEDKGNLMQTEADQAQAEYYLSSALRELKLARLKLSLLLKTEINSAEAEIEIPKAVQPDYKELLLASPAYLMDKAQLDSAQIASRATASGFLPSVSLKGTYSNKGSTWPPPSDSNSWRLSASYAFFPGGSNFMDSTIYKLKLEQATQDFEESEDELYYNLEDSFQGFMDALSALAVGNIYLSASSERATIARVKYSKGLLNYDDWKNTKNDYVNARKNLLADHKTALEAQAAWHQAYGGWVK
ncbi:MAG: TolC family protein [Candidatus Saganbacteria bacterium]|nr:TolC family protein [Candidatus Saganbacteria bacterium]